MNRNSINSFIFIMNTKISTHPIELFLQKLEQIKKEVISYSKHHQNKQPTVQSFVVQSIQKLPPPLGKEFSNWWNTIKPNPQPIQKEGQLENRQEKEDSFKFDSESISYQSSYDDIDDDFRKQQMEGQKDL